MIFSGTKPQFIYLYIYLYICVLINYVCIRMIRMMMMICVLNSFISCFLHNIVEVDWMANLFYLHFFSLF